MSFRALPPLVVFVVLALSLAASQAALSQGGPETCQPVVQQALQAVGNLCDGLSRNSACYGSTQVEATFVDESAAAQFARPGDTAHVTSLQSIRTAPLDESADIWGVSLLRLQASVPDTLPGQGVVFVLFGDVSVENAVAPEDAFVPADEPVWVTAASAVNVRSAPSQNASVFFSVPAGTQLPADATNPGQDWLRVVAEDTVGWVSRSVVNAPAAIDQLPVLTRDSRSPMQSFYLSSTLSDVSCRQAPPLVVIQGPEGVTVDLTVNGVDISMASTIVLRLLDRRTLEVVAVHGNVRVDNLPLPPGFSVSVPLSDDGRSQAGDLVNVHPLSPAELENLLPVEWIPANVVNYPVVLPTFADIQRQVAALGGGGGVVSAAAAAHVNCRSLRLTSPLDAWARKPTTFYWDPAPGATSYRLVLDSVTALDSPTTSATYDMTSVLGIDTLTWSVQALYNGEVACQTRPLTLPFDPFAGGSGGGGSSGGGGCYYDMVTHRMVCN